MLKPISRKVLPQNLRELGQINIISREGKASTGSPVYYGLTDLGKDFTTFIPNKKGLETMKTYFHENKVIVC
ncbi:MAG: winged helix-turn-helix transcriptional regulator [Streptococcus salivarius]